MATPLLVKKSVKSELRVVRAKPSSTVLHRDELYRVGKALRTKFPRKSHGSWKVPANRPDAVSRSGNKRDEGGPHYCWLQFVGVLFHRLRQPSNFWNEAIG